MQLFPLIESDGYETGNGGKHAYHLWMEGPFKNQVPALQMPRFLIENWQYGI
jgi:hypothetical protein